MDDFRRVGWRQVSLKVSLEVEFAAGSAAAPAAAELAARALGHRQDDSPVAAMLRAD